MRRPFFLIFVNAMILIVVFALLTQSLFIVQRMAVVEDLTGLVEVQRGGQGSFQAMSEGSLIKMNDVVRAQDDGMAEFKWLDGTRLKIMPGTRLVVKKATFNSLRQVEQSEFRLDSGKIFVRIVKALSPTSRFEVQTPTAVAAVRGTIFSVEVSGGTTQVAVYRGEVKVSSRGDDLNREKLIRPGEAAVSDKPGRLQDVPSAAADAEFARQSSIVQPQLRVALKLLQDGARALLKGQTEVGNAVAINERRVAVLGNGGFARRVRLQPGLNTFTVTSTDKYGATATVTKTIDTKVLQSPRNSMSSTR